MSESLYEYKPEHFGDTILEGVIVRNIRTCVLHERSVPVGVAWLWSIDQSPKDSYSGPYIDSKLKPVREPPNRATVIAYIADWIRACLADGTMHQDAFEAA